MAPEIHKSLLVGPEVDLWSLGVVLYEMAVAYKPTQLQNYKYGSGPIPYRRVDWRKISPNLQDLINQCLVMDP